MGRGREGAGGLPNAFLGGGASAPKLFDQLVRDLATGIAKQTERRVNPLHQRDPIAWACDTLGVKEETLRWSMNPEYRACHCPNCVAIGNAGQPHKWDGTVDPFVVVPESVANDRNVGVESATGTGKTFVGGVLLVPWYLTVFEQSLVVTTAPKEQQLMLHLWKELGRVWEKFKIINPEAELTKLTLRMKPGKLDWAAVGFACGVGSAEQSATRAQGFHAERMLIITEETPGINQAIMTAFENTCTGDHNIRVGFGNPDSEDDALHQFCLSPTVTHVRISGYDHPNVVTGRDVVPGAVGRRNIEERRHKYGEDSMIFRSRVRGICPAEAKDSLIRRAWCRQAAQKQAQLREDAKKWEEVLDLGTRALGVDVANSERGDMAAIARGVGPHLLEVDDFPCPDASQLGIRVALTMGSWQCSEERVGVDAVGVGASTVNKLKELGHRVQAIQSAAPPLPLRGEEEFGNLRAQMWWKAREDLQHGRVTLPDDDELFAELTVPKFEIRGGKIWVEEKRKLKERMAGGRSPNKADAFVYWNWTREVIAVATRGGRLITL